jgi:phage gp37-like protein
MYTVVQIEDAIIAQLKSGMSYLKTCASMAEFLSSRLEENDCCLPLLSPAVYVVYDRGSYSHKMSGAQDREMLFTIIAVVENLRGDVAARHGQGPHKGAYELLEDIRISLSNHSCGLNIDPLTPLSEEAISGNEKMAVYGISFRTSCRFAL